MELDEMRRDFGVLHGGNPHRGSQGTVGQNRLKGEVSISHVTSSILDVILGICVARNVCYRSKHITTLVLDVFCMFFFVDYSDP